MKTTTKERLDEWREEGPMRRWRRERGFSLHDAAGVLGIGISSLQALEAGVNVPTPDMRKRIAKSMGYTGAGLLGAWSKWLKSRPK